MRISDWSSDVCSSDLADAPADKSVPRRETPVPVVLTRHAAQNLYAPLRTVEPVAGIGRVNLRRGLALDTLLPTLPVHARALAAWRLRSEEHTSELQSLMRISYAVFCLKKKIKNINNIHETS